MNVGRRMSHPVITVQPEMAITKAHEIMSNAKIHQAPVLKDGKLVGLITVNDIQKAYPSSATSLAIWEVATLIDKIKVKDVMMKDVRTVEESTPIEEAARILVDNKIDGLPVMRGEEVVGIITETDLFKIMLEMLGARHPGVRVSALMGNKPGEIARIASAIANLNANITALSTFEGDSASNVLFTVKVENIDEQTLVKAIEPTVIKIVNVTAR